MLIYKPTDRRAGMLGETTFLGDDAVIGANTMVNKDVPANCLAVGNPMRIVREGVDWKP